MRTRRRLAAPLAALLALATHAAAQTTPAAAPVQTVAHTAASAPRLQAVERTTPVVVDGRLDEADRLFASLNEADIPNAGWRVSMIINRLAFLVDSGQFERAAPLLDGAEEAAKMNGNPYSRQLVRTFRYCVYRRTGRQDEAKAIRSEMLKHADDARTATIDLLICAGELDDAEKLALKELSDEGFQSNFVWKLQRKPLSSDDNKFWSAGWAALRQRPAIAKEFDRLGRDLPDHLLPKSMSGGVTSGMLM